MKYIERGSLGGEVRLGSSEKILGEYANRQAHLVFTSPPYWDQRPEYAEYKSLDDYLSQMKAIFSKCYDILREGGICAVNIGQDTSTDLPAHFSLMLQSLKFQYVDTICWNKNAEIGERGQFLSRNLYYPNYTWEPIYIYRKPCADELMGRVSESNFPKFEDRFKDKITTLYRTNMWDVGTAYNPDHPAVFPIKLATLAIMCYSPKGGIVVDPFGGSGTTAVACEEIGDRTFLLIERMEKYYNLIVSRLSSLQGTLGL